MRGKAEDLEDSVSPEEKKALDLFIATEYSQAYDLFKEVYDNQRAQLGPDHPHTLRTLTSISHCLRKLEKFNESLNIITEVIKSHKQTYGPFHKKTRVAIKTKCLLLHQTGNFDEGIELLSDLWEFEETNDISNSLDTLSNLVSCYVGKGDFEKAKAKVLDLIQISGGTRGFEHQQTLSAQVMLANILLNLGDMENAIALGEEVLEKQKEILGTLHEDTKKTEIFLQALKTTVPEEDEELSEAQKEELEDKQKGIERAFAQNKKAFEVYEQGKYQHAMELFTKSWHKLKKYQPEDKLSILETEQTIALLLEKVGRPWEGKARLEEVLKEKEKIFPPNSLDLLTARSNLAVILCSIGKFYQANETSWKVLEQAEPLFGREHEFTLTLKHNIAVIAIHLAKYDFAREMAQVVLEGRKRILADGHSDTLSTLNVLADLMNINGEPGQAYELLSDIYQLRKKHLGETHPLTLNSLHDLSITAGKIGNANASFGLCLRTVKGFKETLGMGHPTTMKVQLSMMSFFRGNGFLKKAKELADILIEPMAKCNGFFHPDTIAFREEFARLTHIKGDLNFAYEIFRMNYHHRIFIYGEDHPATLDSKAWAVYSYVKLLRQARRHLIY